MAAATTGVYQFQVRVNFLRYPPGKEGATYSLKWKRGSKGENKGYLEGGKKTPHGDYSFNAVFTFQSTMQRKNDEVVEKGFHHKWLDLAVYEEEAGRKQKLFDTEFDMANALPPRNDTSPHILLDSKTNASVSLSIGYKRTDNARTSVPSFLSCASFASGPASDGTRPVAGDASRRSRSAGWWSCGGQSTAPPNEGRGASQPKKKTVQFSKDAPEEWERSVRSLNMSVDSRADGEGAAQANAGEKPKVQRSGVEVMVQRPGNINPEDSIREVIQDATTEAYSYPLAPPSSREARERGMRSSGVIDRSFGISSARSSGTDTARMVPDAPKLSGRPSGIPSVSSLSSGRPSGLKASVRIDPASPTVSDLSSPNADATLYYHEVDVKLLRPGGPQGISENDATSYCRNVLAVPDRFSSVASIMKSADLSTDCEIGEISLPRVWTLVWSRSADFLRTLHLQLKDKKFVAGEWELGDDSSHKWCGSRMNTWTSKKNKIVGKVDLVEDSYYCTFKFEGHHSVLFVHTSQRIKDNNAFRVETVYKFWAPDGKMLAELYSKLIETGDAATQLSSGTKEKIGAQVKYYHTLFQTKLVERTQVHLLRRCFTPGLYKKGTRKKNMLSTSTIKRARTRLYNECGASMGTLRRLGSVKPAGSMSGSSYIKVRRLDSFLQASLLNSKKLDQSGKACGRIDEIPYWTQLAKSDCLVDKNMCQDTLKKLFSSLNKLPKGQIMKEGFTEAHVLCLTRLVAAYPNQRDDSGKLEHPLVLQHVLQILQLVSTSSLPKILNAPSAVETILAAWSVSGRALPQFRKFVEILSTQHARGQEKQARSTGGSERLMKHFHLSDQVVDRFSGRLTDETGRQVKGTLYITRSWLCFLSKSTRLMISTYDITKVDCKKHWFGKTLFIHAENRCVDPTDFNNPHAQRITFDFMVYFNQAKAESAMRSVIRGGGRPRWRMSRFQTD